MARSGNRHRIPLYSRAGWITAWLFIAVIIVIALRGCLGAMDVSRKTSQTEIQRYFTLGLKDGRQDRDNAMPEAAEKNPLLRNAYNKGFRHGRDAAVNGAGH